MSAYVEVVMYVDEAARRNGPQVYGYFCRYPVEPRPSSGFSFIEIQVHIACFPRSDWLNLVVVPRCFCCDAASAMGHLSATGLSGRVAPRERK